MNYYEELGIGRDASVEEIRKAFRGVTRLLHPDKQQDEKLQALAAAQMKRLNEVIETLGDAQKRAAYDLALSAEGRQVFAVPVTPARPITTLVAGLVAGCLGMYFLSLLWGSEVSAVLPDALPSTAAQSTVRPVPAPANPRAQRAKPLPPAPVPQTAPAAAKVLQAPELAEISPVPLVAEGIDVGDDLPILPPIVKPAKLEGIWLYAVDPKGKPAQWAYRAEYVELRVHESGGEILGSYRSRYRVPDKPVQPEVAFRFRGPLTGKEFGWEAPHGAKGVIRLQMQGDNLMEASWRVSDAGNIHGLASGSATLVRRMD